MDTESALKRVPAIKGMAEAPNQKSQPVARTREGVAKDEPEVKQDMKTRLDAAKTRLVAMVKEPQFQMLTLSTGAGAITLGAAGGAFGIATGVVTGSMAGVVPALATFGLSIPAGAMAGAAAGLLVGTTTGGAAGGTGAFCLYKYRVQIYDGVIHVKIEARSSFRRGCERVQGAASRAKLAIHDSATKAHEKATTTVALAKAKSAEVAGLARVKVGEAVTLATSTRSGVTSVSAVLGGSLGTAAGGVCGAMAGAAVGLVPAVFTFGLSVPISAGIGLAAGATTGGGAGALGGGACGFVGFTYQEEIKRSAGYLRTKTLDSAAQVTSRVKSLVGAGTGETA